MSPFGNPSGPAPGAVDITGKMDKSANLSDVANAGTARTSLGLGTAATQAASDAPSRPSRYGRPAVASYENFPRLGSTLTNTAALTSGLFTATMFPFVAGEVITTLTFYSGATALSGGNNQWFALLDANVNVLRLTNDDTSTAWAANTAKTLTLSSPYTVLTTGVYYVGLMVNASTTPTSINVAGVQTMNAIAPILAWRDDAHTGLTTPASAPAQFTAGTVSSTPRYITAA